MTSICACLFFAVLLSKSAKNCSTQLLVCSKNCLIQTKTQTAIDCCSLYTCKCILAKSWAIQIPGHRLSPRMLSSDTCYNTCMSTLTASNTAAHHCTEHAHSTLIQLINKHVFTCRCLRVAVSVCVTERVDRKGPLYVTHPGVSVSFHLRHAALASPLTTVPCLVSAANAVFSTPRPTVRLSLCLPFSIPT